MLTHFIKYLYKPNKFKWYLSQTLRYLLSVSQFSCSVVFDCLQSHGLDHTRLPCPSQTPRPCSNSYPSSRWCLNHLVLCSPLLLMSSNLPSIRVFSNESALHIRCPKYWSFSISISPSNEYSGLISLALTGLNFLQSKGLSRAFSSTAVQMH